MSRGGVLGGIGISHSPAWIGAHDRGDRAGPWAAVADGLEPARRWLAAARPDLIVVIYNDHLNHFFLDAYPTFAMGVAAEYALAPEGGAIPPFPPIPGDAEAASAIAESLIARDFDLTLCAEMALDHGAAGPLRLLGQPWAAPVVPIFVNTIRAPLPRPARLHALGAALGAALRALEGRRVVVVGTGGLSHQLHGPGAGRIAREWDEEFLDRLASDPRSLAARSVADFASGAGTEGLESMMWLAMRGALPDEVHVAHRAYHPVGATGLGLIVLEAG